MSSAYGVTYPLLKGIAVEGDTVQTGTYTVASVPDATKHTGAIIYVSNGAAGNAVLAFSDGTNWLRSDTRAAIAAS